MTSAFSWQNSISLCPASFRTPQTNLPVTPGVSWLPAFVFQSPIMKKTAFLGVLKGLVGLHRTVQLQLLQRYWLGHRLGLLWYWMGCLGNEQRSFCRFWDCIQVLHFGLVAQRLKRLPGMRETRFDLWVRKIPWRRKSHPIPVLLPGESHGGTSLVGCSPWGHKEWDMTERLHFITFWILVDHHGYSISSKGFLSTVVDIMVIWVKFTLLSLNL